MATMYNPAHPGRILRQYLGNLRVGEAATRLRIARTTLSRVLNGKAGISADMALRVAEATGTEPTLWMDLQTQHDLWRASRRRRAKIRPFAPESRAQAMTKFVGIRKDRSEFGDVAAQSS